MAQTLNGSTVTSYKEIAKINKIWLSLGGIHEAVRDFNFFLFFSLIYILYNIYIIYILYNFLFNLYIILIIFIVR